MILLMNLTVDIDMTIEGLSYIEVMI